MCVHAYSHVCMHVCGCVSVCTITLLYNKFLSGERVGG